jgi:hypothetical protein
VLHPPGTARKAPASASACRAISCRYRKTESPSWRPAPKITRSLNHIRPQDQTVAIRLEEGGRAVGALKVRFYPNNAIFKIESVVDSTCQPIEAYANATRGGDKHILQNWDDLRVRMGSATYTLSVDYGGGRIDADFVRVNPGP